jgi:hypothetical protein
MKVRSYMQARGRATRVALVATSAGLLLSACSSSHRGTAKAGETTTSTSPDTSTTSLSPSPSTSVQSTTVPRTSGVSLHGFVIASFTCAASLNPGATVTVQAPAVATFLLCPPETPHQQQQPVTVTPSNRGFKPLIAALSAPDEPRQAGQVCTALAVVPSPILARTPSEAVLVRVPVDGCGAPEGAVQDAINEAKSG